MKKIFIIGLCLAGVSQIKAQDLISQGDSLKQQGLLMPALEKYGMSFMNEQAYKIAATTALLWTTQMRDTSFFFLNYALQNNSSIEVLYDPDFLSLIDDPRWSSLEERQLQKYEAIEGPIRNREFAKELFRMIIKDQGFMYAGNIERRHYIQNGGHFRTPAIFPVLAIEEKNMAENQKRILQLLDKYGWPTTSSVTEPAAAGAALIINHSSHGNRVKYFPMLEEAFRNGEAQPLRYAKMKDRLLVENGKKQLYGTQLKYTDNGREPLPIEEPSRVDQRRAEIGLEPLSIYLKEHFGITWDAK